MEHNEIERQRLKKIHRSNGAKIAWKRHHSSYMRGIRKQERDSMNKSFYKICKDLEEAMSEAKVQEDNKFELHNEIIFENMAGGISLKVNNETGDVSLSTILNENGRANYRLENPVDKDQYKNLYNELTQELKQLMNSYDNEIKQIIAKHGLLVTS